MSKSGCSVLVDSYGSMTCAEKASKALTPVVASAMGGTVQHRGRLAGIMGSRIGCLSAVKARRREQLVPQPRDLDGSWPAGGFPRAANGHRGVEPNRSEEALELPRPGLVASAHPGPGDEIVHLGGRWRVCPSPRADDRRRGHAPAQRLLQRQLTIDPRVQKAGHEGVARAHGIDHVGGNARNPGLLAVGLDPDSTVGAKCDDRQTQAVRLHPVAGHCKWIIVGAIIRQEVDVLITGPDDASVPSDDLQPRLDLAPVEHWIADHIGPYVDVIRDAGWNGLHPFQQDLGTWAYDAGQRGDVKPIVGGERGQLVRLPAEVGRLGKVKRVARDPLLIEADYRQRGGLFRFGRQVELNSSTIDIAPQLLAERVRA